MAARAYLSLGDCGQSSITKIAMTEYGIGVHTLEVNAKPKCDGKMMFGRQF